MALEGLLEQHGVTGVDKCFNGRDALSKIFANYANPCSESHAPYKIVILDNRMPLLSGEEAAKQIRRMKA